MPNACASPDRLNVPRVVSATALNGILALLYWAVSAASPRTKTHAVPLPILFKSSKKPPHGSKFLGIAGAASAGALGAGLANGATVWAAAILPSRKKSAINNVAAKAVARVFPACAKGDLI